jgi:NADH-quinone oxidoreductase subunit A
LRQADRPGLAQQARASVVTVNSYAIFLLYLVAILGFVGVTLFMNRWLGPKPVAGKLKLEPFECGAVPVDQVNVKAVSVKYYGIAVVFILFELETVFLFLWALGAQPLTGTLLLVCGFFLLLLMLLVWYVWKSGLLEEVRA